MRPAPRATRSAARKCERSALASIAESSRARPRPSKNAPGARASRTAGRRQRPGGRSIRSVGRHPASPRLPPRSGVPSGNRRGFRAAWVPLCPHHGPRTGGRGSHPFGRIACQPQRLVEHGRIPRHRRIVGQHGSQQAVRRSRAGPCWPVGGVGRGRSGDGCGSKFLATRYIASVFGASKPMWKLRARACQQQMWVA